MRELLLHHQQRSLLSRVRMSRNGGLGGKQKDSPLTEQLNALDSVLILIELCVKKNH